MKSKSKRNSDAMLDDKTVCTELQYDDLKYTH